MDGRSVAWVSYLPLPGLALVPLALRPDDRLVRYHAWQGTVLVAAFLAAMLLVGLLTLLSDGQGYRFAVGLLAGALLLAGVVQVAWGIVAASLGRYARLRPAWDLARLLRQR